MARTELPWWLALPIAIVFFIILMSALNSNQPTQPEKDCSQCNNWSWLSFLIGLIIGGAIVSLIAYIISEHSPFF